MKIKVLISGLLFLISLVSYSDRWTEISKKYSFGKGKYCESIAQAFFYENYLPVDWYGHEEVDFTSLFIKKIDEVILEENKTKHYKDFENLSLLDLATIGLPSSLYYKNYCKIFSEYEIYQIESEFSTNYLTEMMDYVKRF